MYSSHQFKLATFQAHTLCVSNGYHLGQQGLETEKQFYKSSGTTGVSTAPSTERAKQVMDIFIQASALLSGLCSNVSLLLLRRSPLGRVVTQFCEGAQVRGNFQEIILKCKVVLKQVSFTYLQNFQITILFSSEEIFQSFWQFLFFSSSSCWDFFLQTLSCS